MWIETNLNPCRRIVGDCAVRAVAIALNISWEDAYIMLADMGLQMCEIMNANSVIDAVLHEHGFYKEVLPPFRNDSYTAEKFCRDNPVGVYVLGFGTHVATVIDGNLMDAWNSSSEIPQVVWMR